METDMKDEGKKIAAEVSQGKTEWSYLQAMISIFIIAEEKRSKEATIKLKSYISNFFNQTANQDSESIRCDVLAFHRVNHYLNSVEPSIGIETKLSLVTWLKLAHDYWTEFGVISTNDKGTQALRSYHRAFQNKYLKLRNNHGHRSCLALVVPYEIFHDRERKELDFEEIEHLEERYALDVFMLCNIDKEWLKRSWRIVYVNYPSVSKTIVDPVAPKRRHTAKTNIRESQFTKKESQLYTKLGLLSCKKMKEALAQAVDEGSFHGFLEAPKYRGDQYRFNGTRKELYKKLKSEGYEVTASESSGLKIISFYVLCRVWS